MGDMWNSYTNAEGRNVKAWDYQVRTRIAYWANAAYIYPW